MGKCSQETRYLSLKRYHILACNVLKKYGNRHLLRSEDNISFVMYKMMMADKRFDGRGSAMGFRLENARYAVKTLCSQKKENIIYLNGMVRNKEGETALQSLIANEEQSPEAKLDIKETIEYINNSKMLSDLEKKVIIKHYIENTPVKDIIDDLKVSQQLISRAMLSGLEKLRWKFHE